MENDIDSNQDLIAIERLHQQDMLASKTGDFAALRAIMSDDAVVMLPGGNWLRGRVEREASFQAMESAMNQVEVLEYVLDFEEVKVLGNYAFEWGTIRGAMRPKDDDQVEYSSYKVMRILQKQINGEWKVHRTIWNNNPS